MAPTEEITYAWAPINKAEPQEDGSVIVTGQLTDAGRDRDGQAMAQEWLDEAVPKWFDESGNIREQHNAHSAAGVGIGLVRKSDGAYVLQARITDPVAAKKCVPAAEGERPVYQGFSIGIRQPHISFAKAEFPAGQVTGGYICESSLADRPSNPRSLFTMAKSDGIDDEPYLVGEEVEVEGPAPTQDQEPAEVDKADGSKVRKAKKSKAKPTGVDVDGDGDLDTDATDNDGKKGPASPDVSKADEDGDPGYDSPLGGGNNWAAWDAEHRGMGHVTQGNQTPIKISDKVNFPHPQGGTATGHVFAVNGGKSVVAHKGELITVKTADLKHAGEKPTGGWPTPMNTSGHGVSPVHSQPERASKQSAGKIPAELMPEARDAARRAKDQQSVEDEGWRGFTQGLMDAQHRQIAAFNARKKAEAAALGKSEVPDLTKYVPKKLRKQYAKTGVAMSNGDFPIPDRGHLTSAIGLVNNYKGDKAAAVAHIKDRAAKLGVDVDMDADDTLAKVEAVGMLLEAAGWLIDEMIPGPDPILFKADTPREFTDMDKTEVAAMITAAITDATKGIEQLVGDKIAELTGRLDKVEASPVPGGPIQMRSPGQSLLARKDEVKRMTEDRIASLEQRALLTKSEDPHLSRGYQEQADLLRSRLAA